MMWITIYLVILNIITFGIYGYDKHCAIINKWRVSEFTLLALTLGGGSLGALVAMHGFHHKTQHKMFQICVPLFLTIHILLLIIIL
jgi:uncharacterized membrane protein YsdA (DUF1294 family)